MALKPVYKKKKRNERKKSSHWPMQSLGIFYASTLEKSSQIRRKKMKN
jgi:hypothetical protein